MSDTKPKAPEGAIAIPEELAGLYKAASAYAVATRKTDVECEQISEETLNEIEHEFDVECAFFSKADHRNSDFKPFTVRELIERIAALTAENERVREWWSDSYDQEVRAGETLFAAFKKLRDERDKLMQDLAAAKERPD